MLGALDEDSADLKHEPGLSGGRKEERKGVPGKWAMQAERAEIIEMCPERCFAQAHPHKAIV